MIGKLTNDIIHIVLEECKKEDNKEQIKTYIIDPLICYILDRIYPYIFITATIFILILLLVVATLFFIIKKN